MSGNAEIDCQSLYIRKFERNTTEETQEEEDPSISMNFMMKDHVEIGEDCQNTGLNICMDFFWKVEGAESSYA